MLIVVWLWFGSQLGPLSYEHEDGPARCVCRDGGKSDVKLEAKYWVSCASVCECPSQDRRPLPPLKVRKEGGAGSSPVPKGSLRD